MRDKESIKSLVEQVIISGLRLYNLQKLPVNTFWEAVYSWNVSMILLQCQMNTMHVIIS